MVLLFGAPSFKWTKSIVLIRWQWKHIKMWTHIMHQSSKLSSTLTITWDRLNWQLIGCQNIWDLITEAIKVGTLVVHLGNCFMKDQCQHKPKENKVYKFVQVISPFCMLSISLHSLFAFSLITSVSLVSASLSLSFFLSPAHVFIFLSLVLFSCQVPLPVFSLTV